MKQDMGAKKFALETGLFHLKVGMGTLRLVIFATFVHQRIGYRRLHFGVSWVKIYNPKEIEKLSVARMSSNKELEDSAGSHSGMRCLWTLLDCIEGYSGAG